MTKEYASLIGMFFMHDIGEYFRTGEILSEVKDGVYLTKPDDMTTRLPQDQFHLLALEEMLGDTDNATPVLTLFRTREAMDTYVGWLTEPSSPRVVSIVKSKDSP